MASLNFAPVSNESSKYVCFSLFFSSLILSCENTPKLWHPNTTTYRELESYGPNMATLVSWSTTSVRCTATLCSSDQVFELLGIFSFVRLNWTRWWTKRFWQYHRVWFSGSKLSFQKTPNFVSKTFARTFFGPKLLKHIVRG